MKLENVLKSKESLMEILAGKITSKINDKLNKEGIELQKMKLGVEILLINLSKLFILITLSLMMNLLKETILMCLIFAVIRASAFGLHAKSSSVCTIVTLIMFVGGAYVSKYLMLNNYEILIIFTILNILLYKYAPADTESHPLIGADLRKKLKKEAVIKGLFLMAIALLAQNAQLKTMITLAVFEQVVSILPITYKILKRSYDNYGKYEKCIS
ncbi:accessory gene regulator B family protein [Inconstantimicrobium mannanitabidum]|uniref:accessory gene regulator B family protein n=1 Tax=Inconstantimicrobium mannanitabidum TaxID=1604901 RepID=UPI0021C46CF3|nr:accessory gene regulator B family protein [Clostridium sp. TW13]